MQHSDEFKKLKMTTQQIPNSMLLFNNDVEQVIDTIDSAIIKYIKTKIYTSGIPANKHKQLATLLRESRKTLQDYQ